MCGPDPVEMGLVGVQLAGAGLHERGEEQVGGIPNEEGWGHYGTQLEVQHHQCDVPALH